MSDDDDQAEQPACLPNVSSAAALSTSLHRSPLSCMVEDAEVEACVVVFMASASTSQNLPCQPERHQHFTPVAAVAAAVESAEHRPPFVHGFGLHPSGWTGRPSGSPSGNLSGVVRGNWVVLLRSATNGALNIMSSWLATVQASEHTCHSPSLTVPIELSHANMQRNSTSAPDASKLSEAISPYPSQPLLHAANCKLSFASA